jgi:hypothetical protein
LEHVSFLGEPLATVFEIHVLKTMATAHDRTLSEPQALTATVGDINYVARKSPAPVVGAEETRWLGSENKGSA